MSTDQAHIRIGTRGSKLALWQAHFVQRELEKIGCSSELNIIKTQGDRIQHLGFDKLEGKGFFTKEIEDALLRGDIDLAIHSMKDLPTTAPDGLSVTAVSYREDPADWLLLNPKKAAQGKVLQLADGAIVGTSSARRKAQMLDFCPTIQLKDIRGNVPTRIDKLRNGDFDAILLAAAGIKRLELDLSDLLVIPLHVKEFVPAPAQGVLAFQVNTSDRATRKILQKLHHTEVSRATNIERKVLQLMEGGCHMPLGVYCEQDAAQNFHVWVAMAQEWNSPVVRMRESSSTSHQLAEQIVEKLRKNLAELI